jgi:hypothetical protein
VVEVRTCIAGVCVWSLFLRLFAGLLWISWFIGLGGEYEAVEMVHAREHLYGKRGLAVVLFSDSPDQG